MLDRTIDDVAAEALSTLVLMRNDGLSSLSWLDAVVTGGMTAILGNPGLCQSEVDAFIARVGGSPHWDEDVKDWCCNDETC